jgi:hypothetical protein
MREGWDSKYILGDEDPPGLASVIGTPDCFSYVDQISPGWQREALHTIREHLESTLDNFPDGHCDNAAFVVQEVLGYETLITLVDPERVGIYPDAEFLPDYPHAVNREPVFGFYVDLTADQFSDDLPPIAVSQSANPIYTPIEELTKELIAVRYPLWKDDRTVREKLGVIIDEVRSYFNITVR